ncbi:MAG TPA: hypothetical protein VI230_03860 [Ignavibacteriaceae bacterium]
MIKYLVLIVSICACSAGFAQEEIIGADSMKTLTNIENIRSDINLNNSAMIQQTGNYNEANISQTGNSGIFPNAAEIYQEGDFNFASSSQNGNSNLSIIGQYGSNNSADISIIGNYNRSDVLQMGDNNSVQQDLIGDGLNFLIYQEGSGNLINQVQTEPIFMPLQIHQTGNGMRLMIINGGIH